MKKILYLIVFAIVLQLQVSIVNGFENYKIGDQVTYNGVDYYVIDNSDETKNYVELMKSTSLSSGEIEKYSTGDNIDIYESVTLTSQFLPYDMQWFKTNVDNWVEREFGDNAINVDGYKARLLNETDANSLGFYHAGECEETTTYNFYAPKDHIISWKKELKCDDNGFNCYLFYTFNSTQYGLKMFKTCEQVINSNISLNDDLCMIDGTSAQYSLFSFFEEPYQQSSCTAYHYNSTEYKLNSTPDWLNTYSFWTMIFNKVGDDHNWLYHYIYKDNGSLYYSTGSLDSKLLIRPVVNIKKSALGSKSTYNIGDEVIYKGSKYNVLYNVDSSLEYVPVLKQNPLTKKEFDPSAITNDLVHYYSSDTCSIIDNATQGCTNNYDSSTVKNIVDKWANDYILSSDLEEIDGYKVRIVTYDELINNLGYTMQNSITDSYLMYSSDTPPFVYDSSSSPYWIISNIEDQNYSNNVFYRVESNHVNDKYKVRPVVFLKKCAFSDIGCVCDDGKEPVYKKINKYIGKYKKGDIVIINNSKYVVLEDVSQSSKNVKLLAVDILNLDQINKYNKSEYKSIDGEVPYNYTCYREASTGVLSNCSDSYDDSTVKQIVDNWAKDKFGDNFIESHMLLSSDLINTLKFLETINATSTSNSDTEYFINMIASDETLTEFKNSEKSCFALKSDGLQNNSLMLYNSSNSEYYVTPSSLANIRPVITIDKCAIDGGCESIDELIGCKDTDNPKEVEVENTLSTLSKITIIISMIFIVIGLFLYLYNINKIKNKNKI